MSFWMAGNALLVTDQDKREKTTHIRQQRGRTGRLHKAAFWGKAELQGKPRGKSVGRSVGLFVSVMNWKSIVLMALAVLLSAKPANSKL